MECTISSMARKFNIKDLVPRKNSTTKSGYYQVLNLSKYVGDPGKVIYRSSWEFRFCRFCDSNPNVLAWSSETIRVPYAHPIYGDTRTYNVDFYMKVKKEDGTIIDYIVEVKPAKKLLKPQLPKSHLTEKRMLAHNTQMQEYLINMHKFEAAKKWAADRKWQFIIVTEQFLYG